MSYCRFSSDNWKSNVYVYDGSEGITIHIASHRRVGHIPKLPNIVKTTNAEWLSGYKKQQKAIEKCKREKIDHDLAGTTICCRTAKEAIDELLFLKYEGFHVPGFVFDELEQYVKEN